MTSDILSETLPECLVGVELWVGSKSASLAAELAGAVGSRVTLCCCSASLDFEGERSKLGGRWGRRIAAPPEVPPPTISFGSPSEPNDPTYPVGVVKSLGVWSRIVDAGEKREASARGGGVPPMVTGRGRGQGEGPLELAMQLLQAVGKVLDLCCPLTFPAEPGRQGEVQVGGESPQVAQRVGGEELPGVPTQQKIHEIVLLAVHVH